VRGDSPGLTLLRSPDLSALSHPLPADPKALAITPRGDQLACWTADGQLHVIDLDARGTARARAVATGPAERVALAFSDDGASLAIATYEGDAKTCPVQVFSTQTLATPQTFKGARAAVYSLAFSPGAGLLVALTSSSVMAWSLPKGKARTLLRCKSFAGLVGFHSETCLILIDHNDAIVALDPNTGTEHWRHPNYGPASLRGDTLVHNRFEKLLHRDPVSGALRKEAGSGGFPRQIEVDDRRQSAFVVSMAGQLIRRWDLAHDTLDPHPEGWGARIHVACFSGSLLALGTDEPGFLLRDLDPPRQLPPVAQPPGVSPSDSCHAVALAPGQLWASTGSAIRRWDLASGQLLASSDHLKDTVCALLALPDLGLLVACAQASRRTHGELAVLDATSLEVLHSEQMTTSALRIERVAVNKVRVTSEAGWFIFNPVARLRTAHGPRLPEGARSAIFSADGQLLATHHERYDRTTRLSEWSFQVWSTADPPVALFAPIELPGFAGDWVFLADNERILSLHEGALRGWQARTGASLFTIPVRTSRPRSLWVSPDQRRVVVVGMDGACDLYPLPAASAP
jgi:WD40 repeat protein